MLMSKLAEIEAANQPNILEMIVYKPFQNGDMLVENVPHTLPNDEEAKPYLSHKVLLQLSYMFRYMEKHRIKRLSYHQFEKAVIKIDQPKRTKKELIDYVLDEWIRPYQLVKMKARIDQFKNPMDEESRKAQEWLNLFHKTLEALPELHRDIIKKKYLEVKSDGKYSMDVLVYDQLHITKYVYYKQKAEALYRMGLVLSKYKACYE
ncbi:hypothetical protein [Pseudobacillus badius]|uniref:hypothetical protein n=1 Tax=Bacillus badius TaxID=1455 RepID=UPI0024A1B7F8|nr:hypothetical protein [Bacillus badius]GLY12723.1 hypothetical protein Bbad01_39390 [Bacillus badius]